MNRISYVNRVTVSSKKNTSNKLKKSLRVWETQTNKRLTGLDEQLLSVRLDHQINFLDLFLSGGLLDSIILSNFF